jgi:hypothetical protein
MNRSREMVKKNLMAALVLSVRPTLLPAVGHF